MCTNLTNVILPQSLRTIGVWAFANCKNLTNITIPINVTTIEESAFRWCDKLATFVIEVKATNVNEEPSLGENVFEKLKAEAVSVTIYVPDEQSKQLYSAATNWTDYADHIKYVGEE